MQKSDTTRSTVADVKTGEDTFIIPKVFDQYIGGYLAKKAGLLYRSGVGKYITHDGQIYEGTWEADQLIPNKEHTITYRTGCRYEGTLVNHEYSGHGKFFFPDGSYIDSDFVKNYPVNMITLVDTNCEQWAGPADSAKGRATLFQTNVFLQDIPNDLGLFSFAQIQQQNKHNSVTQDVSNITETEVEI